MEHGWREKERSRHCVFGYFSRLPSCYLCSEVFPVDELGQFELARNPKLMPLLPEVICSPEAMEQSPLSLLSCSGNRKGVSRKWVVLAPLTHGVHHVSGFTIADPLGEGFHGACFACVGDRLLKSLPVEVYVHVHNRGHVGGLADSLSAAVPPCGRPAGIL